MERLIIPFGFVAIATVFWLMPLRWRMSFLAWACAALLLWFAPVPVFIMLLMSASTFVVFNMSVLSKLRSTWPGMLLVIGSICAYLIVVKYLPPLSALFDPGLEAARAAVPLGLSYLTFRLVHYAVEARNGRLPAHAFGEFMAYATFLPIFFAGPIERFDRFLAGRTHSLEATDFWCAADRIMKGLIKAFALPALIMALVPWSTLTGAAQSALAGTGQGGAAQVWLILAVATFAYYLNFAGYSDIAIGAGRLLGFRLSENFGNPFVSTSITQFWSRWHITLGDWCRAYVFFPVARVLKSAALGVLATFAVIGLWHDAGLHWLCFGLWHGVGVLAANRFRQKGWRLAPYPPLEAAAGWFLTTAYVTLASAFTLLSQGHSIWESVRMIGLALGASI